MTVQVFNLQKIYKSLQGVAFYLWMSNVEFAYSFVQFVAVSCKESVVFVSIIDRSYREAIKHVNIWASQQRLMAASAVITINRSYHVR